MKDLRLEGGNFDVSHDRLKRGECIGENVKKDIQFLELMLYSSPCRMWWIAFVTKGNCYDLNQTS